MSKETQTAIDVMPARRSVLIGSGAAALTALLPGLADAQAAPTARTGQGDVRGFRRNGAEIFLGIPYGASTAGARRFLPPAPPPSWTGVRDATRLGQRAPQAGAPLYEDPLIGQYMAGGRAQELIALKEPMGEDCLVLNVLTPRADAKGRPVLVYMHGGGFSSGSGAVHTLGDRFVAEEDVVLVTVNHRLSALGFLYLTEFSPRYAANVGMLDLVAALAWVKANIARFGGDPAKVTIFGESGGGAKVSYLLGMPQAKGLFRAAIIESAGGVRPTSRQAASETTRALLGRLKVAPDNLGQLHSQPFSSFLPPASQGVTPPPAPGPVDDGHTLNGSPFGAGAPAISADVPVIVGYCADEATLFVGVPNPGLFKLDWPEVTPKLAALTRRSEADLAPAVAAYRAVYPKEGPSDVFFRMMSLAGLGAGSRLTADAKAAQPAPVYYYRNEYDTGLGLGLRAFHTCELPLANRMVLQPRAEVLSRQIAGAWAAFARTGGDPNHPGLPRWERYRPGQLGPIMIFSEHSRAGADPETQAQAILRKVLA